MNILDSFLQSDLNNRIKIGVIGDAMIDSYYDVNVKKISPEFPIPVMHSEDDNPQDYPGGASNVVYQCKDFNADVKLISFLDNYSETLFKQKSINTSLSLNIGKDIPRKRRFYSDNFPTYRWDIEKNNYGLNDTELLETCLTLSNKVKHVIQDLDVVIFSDYNKGVLNYHFNNLISSCKISIIDPKTSGLERWHGCTVFKPNSKEALLLSGESTIEAAGFKLKEKLACQCVIITKAGDGVSVFDDDGMYEIKSIGKAIPAESVIGAGDCFIAFLAMSLARNFSYRESAEIAWKMGTLYVKNKHNKPIDKIDVLISYDKSKSKILHDENLLKNRDFNLIASVLDLDTIDYKEIQNLKLLKISVEKISNVEEKLLLIVSAKKNDSDKLDKINILSNFEFIDYIIFSNEEEINELIEKIKPTMLS